MRHIKVILAVVAAVTTMMVLAVPAMTDVSFSGGNGVSQRFEVDHISSGGSGGGSTGNVASEGGFYWSTRMSATLTSAATPLAHRLSSGTTS